MSFSQALSHADAPNDANNTNLRPRHASQIRPLVFGWSPHMADMTASTSAPHQVRNLLAHVFIVFDPVKPNAQTAVLDQTMPFNPTPYQTINQSCHQAESCPHLEVKPNSMGDRIQKSLENVSTLRCTKFLFSNFTSNLVAASV
jgi:hypothetical protein